MGSEKKGSTILLYPNPVRSGTPVHISGTYAEGHLELYNARGEKVEGGISLEQKSGELILDSKGLTSGIYYLQLRKDGEAPVACPMIIVD